MNELGYSPKNLTFDKEARDKLISGITKLSKAVKSTLGPQGQTVLIESQSHSHGITVTKDGVTVAKSIDMLDPIENLAVKVMKQAAAKTALDAGDGTTTSIVLAEALVKEIIYALEDSVVALNKTELLNEIVKLTNDFVGILNKKSIKLDQKKLIDVATISANNDKEIGKIIADAYQKVGPDGIVTVEKSETELTYADVTDGFKLDRGYSSHLFVNNHERDECIYENCKVLVCDSDIDNIFQIENVLKPVVKNKDKLLIIANCSTNMINTLAANVMKNGVRVCIIPPPSFGYKSHEMMEDIALSLGAKYFSEKTGDDLSLITENDLGHAAKVTVSRDTTVIVKGEVESEGVDERVAQLKEQYKLATKKVDRDHINNRIASLVGAIGVIYAGGLTDTEQKERFDRIEDAVCAVKAALEDGILPGGGVCLYSFEMLFSKKSVSWGKKLSGTTANLAAGLILSRALKKPFEAIMRNAGCDGEDIAHFGEFLEGGHWNVRGVNAKNKQVVHLIKEGIIDPAKVTKSALLNAVSVATTIMSTNAIITLARTYESQS